MTAALSLLAACGPTDAGTVDDTAPAADEVPGSASGATDTIPEGMPSIASLIAFQIGEHWMVPEELSTVPATIRIDVTLLPDGRVLRFEVIEIDSDADETKQAMVEAAHVALTHFRDHPFVGLPLDQHDRWGRMIVTFDTTQMHVE